MFSPEDKTEWIDRYLDHVLSDIERKKFEELLAKDVDLQLDVKAQQAARNALQIQGDKDLKLKFKQFHSRMRSKEKAIQAQSDNLPEENASKIHWWANIRVLSVAASILVLLTVSSIFWFRQGLLFNTDRMETATSKVFQVPVIEKTGMGYASTNKGLDSIPVQIIADKLYQNHYRFKDSLQIFSQTIGDNTKGWKLEYNDSLNIYTLQMNNKKYSLERGFNRIFELKQK